MAELSEFETFRKIARLRRDCVITEKIDGTNAQISIGENGDFRVGSRNRWILPNSVQKNADNQGFAAWAYEHKDELMGLGVGRHYGEWWGSGIQRGYGLPAGDKRFSLFNVSVWGEKRPACCGVVPVLYEGAFDTHAADDALELLRTKGSQAAPFMNPEGIVVYHIHAGQYFKVTLGDDGHKGVQA